MADIYNPAVLQGPQVTPSVAGVTVCNRSRFDFAVASYRPAAITTADRILIGIVPAGTVLVNHLSRISLPQLSTGTGNYSVGTAASGASLAAAAASNAARVLSGETILQATIGSREVDTPIYAFPTVNSQAVPTTGAIVADLVVRAYDTAIDG